MGKMRGLGWLLAMVMAASCFAGCGRRLEPKPLDAEQERQFEERLEEVRQQEQMHFQQQ